MIFFVVATSSFPWRVSASLRRKRKWSLHSPTSVSPPNMKKTTRIQKSRQHLIAHAWTGNYENISKLRLSGDFHPASEQNLDRRWTASSTRSVVCALSNESSLTNKKKLPWSGQKKEVATHVSPPIKQKLHQLFTRSPLVKRPRES